MPDSAFKLAARNFLKLDLLAPTINLKLRGESEVKTYTGAAFSFVAVSIFTALSIYTLKESLRTDNPNVLVEHMNSRQYPQIDLRKTKQMPMLIVISAGKPVPVWELPSFIHIRMAVRINVVRDNQRFYTEDTPIPLVPCAELGWDAIQEFSTPDSEPLEKLFVMASGICPNITGINLVVQGKLTSLLRHTLEITVYPCVPELLLPNQTCMPLDSNPRLHLLRASPNLDLKNYDSPVTYSANVEDFHALSLNSELNVHSNMKIVEVRNNEWGLYAESLVHTYSQIDQTKSDYYPRNPTKTTCTQQQILSGSNCRPIALITISSGGKKEVYTRGYRTVLEFVAMIGGIRALIFTLFFYFYGLFSSCTVKRKLQEIIAERLTCYSARLIGQSDCSEDHNIVNQSPRQLEFARSQKRLAEEWVRQRLMNMFDIEKFADKIGLLEDLASYLGIGSTTSNITSNHQQKQQLPSTLSKDLSATSTNAKVMISSIIPESKSMAKIILEKPENSKIKQLNHGSSTAVNAWSSDSRIVTSSNQGIGHKQELEQIVSPDASLDIHQLIRESFRSHTTRLRMDIAAQPGAEYPRNSNSQGLLVAQDASVSPISPNRLPLVESSKLISVAISGPPFTGGKPVVIRREAHSNKPPYPGIAVHVPEGDSKMA